MAIFDHFPQYQKELLWPARILVIEHRASAVWKQEKIEDWMQRGWIQSNVLALILALGMSLLKQARYGLKHLLKCLMLIFSSIQLYHLLKEVIQNR